MADTERVTLPKLSATMALGSVVPLTAAVPTSTALMKLSPATVPMEGGFGATVSTTMLRVPAADLLPTASVAVAESVSGPWSIAAMSSGVSV